MTPSWDLFIIISFVVIASMGVMLGRSKILNVLVGSFVGYVVASELGALAFNTASQYSSNSNISLFTVKSVMFFLTILILNSKTELAGKSGDEGSSLITAIYGLLAGGFITTALLSFLDTNEKEKILANSSIITYINDLKIFWIVGPVLFLIFADFLRGRIAK